MLHTGGVPADRFPTPPPERRRRRWTRGVLPGVLATVAVVLLALLLVRPALTGYDPRGAEVDHVTLHSRILHRDLEQTTVLPRGAGAGRPLLVFLHGRGSDGNDSNLSDELFAGLERLGRRAPAIVFPDGGEASYWHDRADGDWGAYVLREVIPTAVRLLHADPRRIAIGGISMGGFGAYDLARREPGRFCAVGGHSAALFGRAADTAPGAFDDAADFARHDLIAAARADAAPWRGRPLWIDVGGDDPFRAGDEAFAAALRDGGASVQSHAWPGRHEGDYWRAHIARYLRFYADALARCGR
jgi:poly(3-hydroxybutyrate) depolymerase